MNHPDRILFFLQICVMLATALVFGQLMRKLGYPAVLGELGGEGSGSCSRARSGSAYPSH